MYSKFCNDLMRSLCGEDKRARCKKKQLIFCEFNDLIVPQPPIFAEPEDNEGIKGKTWIR